MEQHSKTAIFGALFANLAVAVSKFIAAASTGSSAMLSEGIHSTIDTGNQLLLLLGISRSKRPPDRQHVFGHGKEIYFWTLIVAILFFAIGGGLSLYEGVLHWRHPEELQDPTWNYIVLAAAILFEGISLLIAVKKFGLRHRRRSFWQRLRGSKDPGLFVVIFEDGAALIGLLIAILGVWLSHYFHNPLLDAAASIGIGFLLCSVAILMIIESRNLLLGESADSAMVSGIHQLAENFEPVQTSAEPLTMQFAPDQIMVAMQVVFAVDQTSQLLKAKSQLRKKIHEKYPQVTQLYIEAVDSLSADEKKPEIKTADQ